MKRLTKKNEKKAMPATKKEYNEEEAQKLFPGVKDPVALEAYWNLNEAVQGRLKLDTARLNAIKAMLEFRTGKPYSQEPNTDWDFTELEVVITEVDTSED